MARTLLDLDRQADLRKLFSVCKIMRSRGFEPELDYSSEAALLSALGLDTDRKKAFAQVKSCINSPDYIVDLIEPDERYQFSRQFEWYAGELFINNFSSFSHEVGLKIDGQPELGDYDSVVVNRDLSFTYIECKSGNFGNNDINKAITRAHYVHANSAVIFYLDMADDRLKKTLTQNNYPDTPRSPDFQKVSDGKTYKHRWNDCFFIKIDADAVGKISLMLRVISAREKGASYEVDRDNDTYCKLGIEMENL